MWNKSDDEWQDRDTSLGIVELSAPFALMGLDSGRCFTKHPSRIPTSSLRPKGLESDHVSLEGPPAIDLKERSGRLVYVERAVLSRARQWLAFGMQGIELL